MHAPPYESLTGHTSSLRTGAPVIEQIAALQTHEEIGRPTVPANPHKYLLSFPNSVGLYLSQMSPDLYIGRSERRYARGMSRGLA